MRRSDREITDKDELVKLVDKFKVVRLAMCAERGLYIVPMNYGYEVEDKRLILYAHSARAGRKIDILKENNEICFEMDGEYELITALTPCKYSNTYESLIGYGTVEFLEGFDAKSYALNKIMKHQSGREFSFTESSVDGTAVFRINVTVLSGKRHSRESYMLTGGKTL